MLRTWVTRACTVFWVRLLGPAPCWELGVTLDRHFLSLLYKMPDYKYAYLTMCMFFTIFPCLVDDVPRS